MVRAPERCRLPSDFLPQEQREKNTVYTQHSRREKAQKTKSPTIPQNPGKENALPGQRLYSPEVKLPHGGHRVCVSAFSPVGQVSPWLPTDTAGTAALAPEATPSGVFCPSRPQRTAPAPCSLANTLSLLTPHSSVASPAFPVTVCPRLGLLSYRPTSALSWVLLPAPLLGHPRCCRGIPLLATGPRGSQCWVFLNHLMTNDFHTVSGKFPAPRSRPYGRSMTRRYFIG